MGATASKTPKKSASSVSPFASSNKRASKRILKRNSAIYPSSTQPQSENSENIENNNNSPHSLLETAAEDATVVIRNKGNVGGSNESIAVSTPKSAKKEKKKKKSDAALSGDDAISAYHQTNVCYYKVENGKFLKLPNDTKHKSNDGCYVKLSNGSFRHLMVPDGAGSRPEVNFKPNVRQSMPVQKLSDKERERNEDRQQPNRKVMVTMIDGGLPVVAVSKREKTNSVKKDKEKVKVNMMKTSSLLNQEIAEDSKWLLNWPQKFFKCVIGCLCWNCANVWMKCSSRKRQNASSFDIL